MAILINNLQDKIELDDEVCDTIESVIKGALVEEKVEDKEVSVALVDNQYIKGLNQKYRKKDKATDVLSFPLDDKLLLGDIIISLERAKSQAKEYNHSFLREVSFLSVHGILHLLGYGHYQEDERKIMRAKEEKILSDLGLVR